VNKNLTPFSEFLMKERFGRKAASLLLVLALAGGDCLAQMQMPMGNPSDSGQIVPPAQLPAPLRLTGIGTVHFPISANAEAQAWFDQGINLFYDFWDYEAARAFEQSIRTDPTCAMCYWGLYQAESMRQREALQYALEPLKTAESLANHATEREKLYIQAAQEYEDASAKTDPEGSGDARQIETLRALVKKNPSDTNARIFLAEALEDGFDKNGEPHAGEKEAQALFQGVLREEPNNSAANHLYIHAVEASAHPEQALASASILASLAPTSGHMVHMPGHIYYRLGEYARAQTAFDASTVADESYMQEQHVAVDNDWNYVHNLMYSVANLLEEGQFKDAEQVSAKLVEARGHRAATLYPWSPRDSIARLNPQLPVALRAADWAAVSRLIDSAEIPPSMPHLEFLAGNLAEFALGMQAMEARQPDTAERHSVLLDSSLWRLSQETQKDESRAKTNGAAKPAASTDPLAQPLLKVLTILSLELRGTILAAQGRISEAEELFSSARDKETDLGYHEPPWYIRPASESEAEALMVAGKWPEAEAAYRKALAERPRSGFPLYGIALAEERAGAQAGATAAYRQFLDAWKTADPQLPQVKHARQWLGQHAAPFQSQASAVRN
jgi:tetratricopeptide (TPR) repeat protein